MHVNHPLFYTSVTNITAVTVFLISVSSKLSQPVISAFCGMGEGEQFMVAFFLFRVLNWEIPFLNQDKREDYSYCDCVQ